MWRPEHRAPALTADQVRQIEALDLLLAGGPAAELDPRDRALAEIVGAVTRAHPPLRSAFADELGARLTAGFPRRACAPASAGASTVRPGPGRQETSGRLGRLRRIDTRQGLIGLGAATSVVLAAVVLAGHLSQTTPPHATSSAPVVPAPLVAPNAPGSTTPKAPSASGSGVVAAPSAARAAPGVAAATPASASASGLQSLAPPATGRAVQSDASLALLAPRGQVQEVTDQAIAATDRLGGIVESSNVAIDDHGGSQATLSLELPSASLDEGLATLSRLARVSSRTQSTLDITDATGAAEDRLTASRDERDALLRQLGRAGTPNQVASIDAQLGLVEGRITQDQTHLQTLQGQARMASVSLTVAEAGQASAGGGGGSAWTPTGALGDALTVLEAAFAGLVIALAGLVPAGVIGALAWWAARVVRRRRRQAALAG